MLKIRLRKQGRINRPFFRLVVTDERTPRDGKYLEMLGWYNPLESIPERNLAIKEERIAHWLELGAQLSESAKKLVRQAAPQLLKERQQRVFARNVKLTAKRRERRRAAKKAAA
jgi:small subunit ribosomal protein S16